MQAKFGNQHHWTIVLTALLLATVAACSKESASPAMPVPAARADSETVNYFMTVAGQAAGFEHIGLYNTTCARIGDPTAGRARPPENRESPDTWGMQPAQVFDNVYWVGEYPAFESNPGAWAVTTSDGIIVLDALFAYSVATQIAGGLEKMGLDPHDIRYVLVSHGHRDHFGGARYLQDQFGATVLMSEADWDLISARATSSEDTASLPDPAALQFIHDGDTLVLGDTAINMYLTPGHTPGTVSYTLPVFDQGTAHTAAVWGGTGFAFRVSSTREEKLAAFRQYNESAQRFRDIVIEAGADVMLGNHSYLVLATEKNALLAARQPGDPNPYVLGVQRTRDYMDVAVACSAAGMASFN